MAGQVNPDASPGDRLAAWLAGLALALPVIVLVAIGVHAIWLAGSDPLSRPPLAAIAAELGQLSLTPAGRSPRDGPGSHPAVDRRHSPLLRPSSAGAIGGKGR